jgi:hypothetical protein
MDAVPVGDADVARVRVPVDPGDVGQHVYPSAPSGGGCGGVRDRVRVAQVGLDRQPVDLTERGFQGGGVDVDAHHGGPAIGEGTDGRPSDPARGACDDGDPSGEIAAGRRRRRRVRHSGPLR